MLRLAETKGTVYKAEAKGNMVVASMQTGKKNKDGTWENMWWNLKFVGADKNEILEYSDKAKVKLISANVESSKYNDKTYTNVVVFEYEIIEGNRKAATPLEEETEVLPF